MRLYFGLEYDEIIKRLIDTKYDSECYNEIIKTYTLDEQADTETKKFEKGKDTTKIEMLKKALYKARASEKFLGWKEEAILIQIMRKVIDSHGNKFKKIFGHVSNEKDIYPQVNKFLKKKYPSSDGFKVVETYNRKGKKGIRLADFTVYKGEVTKGGIGSFLRYTLGSKIISIEVKTLEGALERVMNQIADYSMFSDEIYVIVTPELIFRTTLKKENTMENLDASFYRKIKRVNAGTYVYDPISNKFSPVQKAPVNDNLDNEKRKLAFELLDEITHGD